MRALDVPLTALFDGPAPAWIQTVRQKYRQDEWRDPIRAESFVTGGTAPWLNDVESDSAVYVAALYDAEQPFPSEFFKRPLRWEEGDPLAQHTVIGVFRATAAGPTLHGQQMVHGGAIAALFDHVLGMTNMRNGTKGVTAQLQVSFKKPVPLHAAGTAVLLHARVDCVVNRKKIYLSGEMLDGATGEVYGTAKGLWIALDMNYNLAAAPSGTAATLASVPIAPVDMCSKHAVTHLGAKLLTLHPQLVLDNAETPENANQGSRDSSFQYYLRSPRLRRDFLWDPQSLSRAAARVPQGECMEAASLQSWMTH